MLQQEREKIHRRRRFREALYKVLFISALISAATFVAIYMPQPFDWVFGTFLIGGALLFIGSRFYKNDVSILWDYIIKNPIRSAFLAFTTMFDSKNANHGNHKLRCHGKPSQQPIDLSDPSTSIAATKNGPEEHENPDSDE